LIGVVELVDDLDVGLALELGNGVVADVVGPIIDVQDLLFGPGRRSAVPAAARSGAKREPGGRGS